MISYVLVPFFSLLSVFVAYMSGYRLGKKRGLAAPIFRPVRRVEAAQAGHEPTRPVVSQAAFQRMPGTDLGRRVGGHREPDGL